jgi:hypothetical protein
MVAYVIKPKYYPLYYGSRQRFHFFLPGIGKVYIEDSQKRWEFPAVNNKGEVLFTYQLLQKKDYKIRFPGKEDEYTSLEITYASKRKPANFFSVLSYFS